MPWETGVGGSETELPPCWKGVNNRGLHDRRMFIPAGFSVKGESVGSMGENTLVMIEAVTASSRVAELIKGLKAKHPANNPAAITANWKQNK